MILPGDQIGVLGGGQLGMFFAKAARQMGYSVSVWDPDHDAPARFFSDRFIGAPFDDPHALLSFLVETKGVTYEWENIPADMVEKIEKEVTVRPGHRTLRLIQNRANQKQFLREQGLPVVPFYPFHDPQTLSELVQKIGLPCIIKTATAGYDGRGQWNLEQPDQVHALSNMLQNKIHSTGWIVEKKVSYLKELSVLVVQNERGDRETYPIAENGHENGILRMSHVPAELDSALARKAISIASSAVKAFSEAGVFCVELFLMKEGDVLINELAPRPHNSGHYTMDICSVSQFEQQVRALCGLPLIAPTLNGSAVLINILGDEIRLLDSPKGIRELLSIEGARLYHYRKKEIRAGRKMGHLTVTGLEPEQVMDKAQTALAFLRG